jgi:hypothetical protein
MKNLQGIRFDPVKMRPGIALSSSLSEAELVYDEDGFFEVLISREKPAGYEGLCSTSSCWTISGLRPR